MPTTMKGGYAYVNVVYTVGNVQLFVSSGVVPFIRKGSDRGFSGSPIFKGEVMKYSEVRGALIEGVMEKCWNCGCPFDEKVLREITGREVDEYLMPKLFGPLEELQKQTAMFKEE